MSRLILFVLLGSLSVVCFSQPPKAILEQPNAETEDLPPPSKNKIRAPRSDFFPNDIFPPNDSQYDWVQLDSRELIKGEINYFYSDTLEFESDGLDTLTIDWDDVRVLQSSKHVSIGLNNRKSIVGRMLMIEDKIYINGTVIPRHEIITIISGDVNERNFWSIKATIGSNLQQGNTNQLDLNAQASIARRTTLTRLLIDFIATYSENESEILGDNIRLTANYDWFLSERFFIRPVQFAGRKDPFQNIDNEYTVGAGFGYDAISKDRVEWTISTGPAYKVSNYVDVLEEAEEQNTIGTATFESQLEIEITNNIDFSSRYAVQYSYTDDTGYFHHTLTGISIDIADIFDIDFSVMWDRTENPQANSEGIVPEANDYQYIVGIGIDL